MVFNIVYSKKEKRLENWFAIVWKLCDQTMNETKQFQTSEWENIYGMFFFSYSFGERDTEQKKNMLVISFIYEQINSECQTNPNLSGMTQIATFELKVHGSTFRSVALWWWWCCCCWVFICEKRIKYTMWSIVHNK